MPAWYLKKKSEIRTPKSEIYVGIEAPPDLENWTQDPDTLDTWFSSWLWAYETMDEVTRKKFYPTSVLVTAPDIIFFWVARMIIAGLEFKPGKSERDEDNIPFRDVFFTGLIRDKQGRKMSKSLGNSPDPIELIDKYGADGVRVGMLLCSPAGNDLPFDESLCEQGRNFSNKLWNAFRLVKGWSIDANAQQPEANKTAVEWFNARFNEQLELINDHYSKYRMSEVLMT